MGINFTKDNLEFISKYTKADDGINAFQDNPLDKQEFAKEVLEWIDDIMINFKHLVPSESTLSSHLNDLNDIFRFKYDLYQIVKDAAEGGSRGIYPNSAKWYLDKSKGTDDSGKRFTPQTEITSEERKTGNYSMTVLIPKEEIVFDGEAEHKYKYGDFNTEKVPNNNPVLWYPEGEFKFYGNFFYLKDLKETFEKASPLLILSVEGEDKGDWFNTRFFRDTDLSALLDFINTIKLYLEGALKLMEGVVAQILKYIHLLKTRIAQVQAIIAKIKSLIDLVLSFRFPAGLYCTFHLAEGTGGLVTALMKSEDKPDIGVEGYGSGFMAVAGGVPSILVDFFIALLGGESTQEGN